MFIGVRRMSWVLGDGGGGGGRGALWLLIDHGQSGGRGIKDLLKKLKEEKEKQDPDK